MSYQIGQVGYTALFIKDPQLLISLFPPKHEHIFGHHVTLRFNPENFKSVAPGKVSKISIIGRVFDEKGDALLVDTDRSEKKYPHITLSTSGDTRRSYSDEMIEHAVSLNQNVYIEPVEIEVIEGYFNGEQDIKK